MATEVVEDETLQTRLANGMVGPDDPDRSIEVDGPDASPDTLPSVFRSFFGGVVHPDGEAQPLLKRVRDATSAHAPRIPEASRNSAKDVITWTRSGSTLRALFVISVGSIALVSLTGVLLFMIFLAAATVNAVVVSLLMAVAAFGGFLAIFFGLLAAIYIGVISVAFFTISAATISTIFVLLVVTGWIGFFWMAWTAAKKSVHLTKQSIDMSCSAISAYSASRQHRDS
ncbi:hypothetical protein LUZ61_011285 [Rhynchospora tenuis]|uniref:Transmembrane protein n=1 Tax=Rhynchospora tenuis TaxID=198213 RepID=A0AAD6A0U7_9POAL|nr:hypothetical protein LUZ61_011285 [Rhynchospora tenuis]